MEVGGFGSKGEAWKEEGRLGWRVGRGLQGGQKDDMAGGKLI